MPESDQFWFPAKTYGWGWGLPVRWQGWFALAVYVALAVLGSVVWHPARDAFGFNAYMSVITLIFVGVCYLKGEPTRWRWGK